MSIGARAAAPAAASAGGQIWLQAFAGLVGLQPVALADVGGS